MHISPRFEQDAMAIPEQPAQVEPIQTPPCYKQTTENPLEDQNSEEDKTKTPDVETQPVAPCETEDQQQMTLPVYQAPSAETEANQSPRREEKVFEFEDGIMVPEDKEDDGDGEDNASETDKQEDNNEESKEFEETQEDEPTEAGKEEVAKEKEEKEEEEDKTAEEMTTFDTAAAVAQEEMKEEDDKQAAAAAVVDEETPEEVLADTQEVPVTTAVTTTAETDVPPPRPPKPTEMQRRSLEIFPDEDEPKADPFDVLALPPQDPLIDELFGADGNPSDSEQSQSPTHFETLHHRMPPPRPDGAAPFTQSQPAQTQAQHSIFLRRPNEAHHSPSQFRASLSEKADRLKKKWLK